MNATDSAEILETTEDGRALLNTAQSVLKTYAAIKWPEGADGAWFAAECVRGKCINQLLSSEIVVSVMFRNGNDFGKTAIDLPIATQRALDLIDRDAPEWLMHGWQSCTADNRAKLRKMLKNI